MKISVIIPTFNSVQYLPRCLTAVKDGIHQQDGCEIIIVDNGSTDETVRIAESFGVRVLQDRSKTVAGLRNWAAKEAEGDVLFFLDSDCVVNSGWFETSRGVLSDASINVVGCWYALPERATWVQKAWDSHMSRRRKIFGETDWLPSGNLWIRRSVFEQVGGFSEDLQTGEDTDFCWRLREKGFKIISVPDLTVIHLGEAASLSIFFKKQLWHGQGGIQRFVREFPKYVFDKTFLFSCINFVCVLGVIVSGACRSVAAFLICIACFLFVPIVLAGKSAIRTQDFKNMPALIVLYCLYGLARMVSFLNIKLWLNEIKGRRR